MSRTDLPDLSRTWAVLLAGGEATRLHELSAIEAKPALPIAGRRLADFAVASAVEAGLPRLLGLLGPRPGLLSRHLADLWGDRISLVLRMQDAPDTLTALARARPDLDEADVDRLVILPADQVQAIDLRALLASHMAQGAPATLASTGPVVLERRLLSEVADAAQGDIWNDVLPRLANRDLLARWSPPQGTHLRDIDTLDDLREASLGLQRGALGALLPGNEVIPLDDSCDLAFETGGIALSVPRFGARQPGRWTVLEDTLVMPGARVAPGARLTRAIVAPGAIVPAGLVVGEDPSEDARWFRVTPGGTTLLTPPMLAARAAERMRARLRPRPPAGLAHSGS
ncbi:sugar phosphate nucleotidyltransferase [Rubellimicrobium roseum]|uniref:sugar phosphate nucleotidyltransferase n=1 Tax=Rubellimicrobium roseum TaxID=687525 RepID=UPI00159B8F8F|nr:sugar phosphate nucleotidyltransferase [Rubellimicrobium roseum]